MDLIQVVQCNYLLRGKWQTEWQFGPSSHRLYCYDYLYSPHWFPDDIMTCNFHKQSPWEEACCSFESHDLGTLLHPGYIVFFFSCSLILYSLLPSVLPLPHAHIHKQMGISKKLKSHFWQEFNPFLFFFLPQSFWHRNGQFMTAKLSEHTSAHIHPWQFLLTRWEVFFVSCLMWYRYGCYLSKPRQAHCNIPPD